MAFHLVSRILSVEDPRSVRGTFQTPASGPALAPCLVAEAIGQLAAWAAMARFDFALRPVAGLAGDVEFFAHAPAAAAIELAVAIDRLDEAAIAYGGTATLAARPLLEMRGCVGPMMPMADFEEPAAARARFERLSASGEIGLDAAPEPIPLETGNPDAGKSRRALLRVPREAPYFADHFPLRAVFPGTLLLDAEVRLAAMLAAEAAGEGAHLTPQRARSVKFRAFLTPGETVELEAAVASADPSGIRVRVGARRDGQRVGDARIEIASSPARSGG